MSRRQRAFYSKWKRHWEAGEALDVAGYISYLFVYFYSVYDFSPEAALREFKRLATVYAHEEYFASACLGWCSDYYIMQRNYRRAIQILPARSRKGDSYLTLKRKIGGLFTGEDALALVSPRLGQWGRDNIELVKKEMNRHFSSYQKKNGIDLLSRWSRKCKKDPFAVFAGVPQSRCIGYRVWYEINPGFKNCRFSLYPNATGFVQAAIREVENNLRAARGLPRVGEGWMSETELYYRIKNSLSNYEVIHHCSPQWLGRQHFDIYIPELNVAVEYQGRQHDEPIEYFGGLDGFELTQERDARKKRLCEDHQVRLICARPDYVFEDVLKEIVAT